LQVGGGKGKRMKIISAKHNDDKEVSTEQIETDLPKVLKIFHKPSFDFFNRDGGVITIGDRNYLVEQ
jgi:hypothetical protein